MRLAGKFKSLEEWASVSPERERLLVILVVAVLGVLVLVTIGIVALLVSLPGRTG